MNLTPKALATMARLGDRYAADGFPNPWTWLIAKDDFEGTGKLRRGADTREAWQARSASLRVA